MKAPSLTRTLLEGAGAGILLTLGLSWNQLSSFHLDLYHRQLPVTSVIRAIAFDVVIASMFGALLAWLLHRFDPRNRTILWTLFGAALAARATGGLITAEVLTRQGITPIRVVLAVFATGGLLWLVKRSWYSQAMWAFQGALLLIGFSILWIVPQLFLLSFARQPRDDLAFANTVPHQATPHRRIVWLLFDEMSYDQLFDHRRAGLEMPNFDRLREQSITFSDVTPDGYYTEEVLPSLLLGQPVTEIRSSVAGQLILRNAPNTPWKPFDADATLFANARQRNLTTGLVGSYNPYCRLLSKQLNDCWTELLLFGDHLSGQKSTLANVVAPSYATVARTLHWPVEHTPTDAEKFDAMLGAAQALLKNEDIDFAFVHLPVPHPPGIYDRKTGRITTGGSYVDNLALADRTLGTLEAALATTASAAQTVLIVSSDHSWRVPMWRNAIGWTAEDEQVSQGKFEPRPILMVRLPGQTQPVTISRPFPALKEHDLIESLLKDSLSPEELKTWVASQPASN